MTPQAVILHPLGRLNPILLEDKLHFTQSRVDRVFVNIEKDEELKFGIS